MWALVHEGQEPTVYRAAPEAPVKTGAVIPFVEPGGKGKLFWTRAQGFHRVPPPDTGPTPEERIAALEARVKVLEGR